MLATANLLMIVPPRAISLTFSTRLAGDFDKWAHAAIGEAKTAFTSGRYDGDFEKYSAPGARRTAESKGAAFPSTWIYSIGMCEEAVNLCATAANTTELGFWDKKKSKPSEFSNPRALATCQLEPPCPYRVPGYSLLSA